MGSVARPEILLLSLAFQSSLNEIFASLIDSLGTSAKLKRAKTCNAALRYLEANSPKVILVTDGGMTKTKNRAVLEKVESYVRNGGMVIFGLHFPSSIRVDVFDKFSDEAFGLPWKRGDYHRTTFEVNPDCSLPAGVMKDSLPWPYSMKVAHVKNAREHEKIFILVSGAMTQSRVFPPSYVDEAQAAIVGAKVGDGFLVYAGDVNGEEGSEKVILALCDL